MNILKRDEVVILLGAGASKDAGIPHSVDMVHNVERLIKSEWKEYEDLYNYLKSSVYYSAGIRGVFDSKVNFNIERIVNTLDELIRKEEHPLYPFVGAWNPKLIEVSGPDFNRFKDFRLKIVEQLRDNWIPLEYDEDAEYYKNLIAFQENYQHPLRVFSLNYDLCVEKHCSPDILERGFEDKVWDWRLFELDHKNIYLYKLHGSTDWIRENGQLTYKSSPQQINHEDVEIIFGTSYKLQYVDPFLFFAYELRKWTLSEAKLIISIGYGFGDDHINSILGQALNSDQKKVLLSIAPFPSHTNKEDVIQNIKNELDLYISSDDQIFAWDLTAKKFMEDEMDLRRLSKELFPKEVELFSEVEPE